MKMRKRRWSAYLAVMSLLIGIQAFLVPLDALASMRIGQTKVRVGYYMLDGFQTMDEAGNKSGYGYDFLRKTTRYLNVDYEYLGYGERSFNNMLKQLKAGEIDLLVGVIDRPSRRPDFLFSEPMGTRIGTMFMEEGNTKIVSGDYSTYDGMKVGFLTNSSLVPELTDLAKEKGFDYKPVYYETFEELNEALKQGKVDTILTCFRFDMTNKVVVERLDSKEYYAIVKKGNTELLEQMNYAIEQMNAIDGNWKTSLDSKHYTHNHRRNITFTQEELAIIRKYREEGATLKVACSADRKPYSYVEDGKMVGIIPDYFRKLAKYAGISYEMMIPKDREEYSRWQEERTADVFIDARVTDENEIESYHSTTTVPYITMRLAMVTRKDYQGDLQTIAVAEEQGTYGIEEHISKNLEVTTVESREAALEEVLDGNVDATVVYLYTAQEYVNRNGNGLLTYSLLEQPTYEYCMVVTNRVEQQLAGILTKCIYAMPESALEEIAESHTRYKSQKLDFLTWIQLYPSVAVIGGVIVLVFCVMLAILIERHLILRKERRRTKELSTLNAEVSAESRAKSLFFANMSHDIRTPMNVIMGLVSIMEHEPEISEKMRKNLGKVKVSGEYLLSIMNNVLDMTKIEASEVKLAKEPISLQEQMRQIDDIIRSQSDAKGQTLALEMEGLQHDNLLCDSIRLKQVLVNLLSNAIKYTPNGGRIQLKVSELPTDRDGYARYEFTVADNGNGMTKEYIQHVYEPFSRSESSLTNKEQGIGLGLSITKSIVDLMEGEIFVDSEVGVGTTFRVVLELQLDAELRVRTGRTQTSEVRTALEKNQSVLEGRHFLCAEDNELNAEILEALLEMKGATCTIYENGAKLAEAFEKTQSGEYDAIFMDIQMPVMNGYEATKRIREGANPLGKEIPIIAMTANAFSEDIHQSMEAGMDAHISKPIDIVRIEACVRQVLFHEPGIFGGGRRDKREQ